MFEPLLGIWTELKRNPDLVKKRDGGSVGRVCIVGTKVTRYEAIKQRYAQDKCR